MLHGFFRFSFVNLLLTVLLPALSICAEQNPEQFKKTVVLEQSSDAPSWGVVFNRDKTLVVGGLDEVKVWDVKTGRVMLSGKAPGLGVAFSPDGKMLAVPTYRNGVSIWAVTDPALQQITSGGIGSGSLAREFIFSKQWRFSLATAFSPNLKLLATGNGDDTITLWDFATGKEQTLHQQFSNGAAIAFSEDGKSLASGGRDGTVRIWDVAKGAEKTCLKGYPGRVARVAFADRDRLLIATAVETKAGGFDSPATVLVSRLPDGKVIAQYPKTDVFGGPAITPNGPLLATISEDAASLDIWNLNTSARVFQKKVQGPLRLKAVEFVSENKVICVISDGKQLSVLHLDTKTQK